MHIIRLYTSIICGLLLCSVLPIDALVITVTNTGDAGAGSLRDAIIDLNFNGDPANNMIVFDLPGPGLTISLVTQLPPITKQVTIDGLEINSGNRVTIDGISTAVGTLAGLHFSTNDSSNSIVTNVVIQNFENDMDDGSAYGILCDADVHFCSVVNCIISTITSGKKILLGPPLVEAMGIRSFNTMNTIINNEINNITSASDLVALSSGDVAGVYVENTVFGLCSDNLVDLISSGSSSSGGSSSSESGFAYGIFATTCNNDCIGNIITAVTSGGGLVSGNASGIHIPVESTQRCSGNIVALIASGDGSGLVTGNAIGIQIGVARNIDDNIISEVTSGNSDGISSGSAYGIFAIEAETVNRNSASSVSSGSAVGVSGLTSGITMETLIQKCNTNLVNGITGGTAPGQGGTSGMFIMKTATGVSISSNTISNVTGSAASASTTTAGLYVQSSNRPAIENNSITSVAGIDEDTHGVVLGCISFCGPGPLPSVTNGNLFNNTISNIIGSMSNGFGISIAEQSKGNDILYTSIFNINGKAINIIDNGAPVDAIVILEKVECCQKNNTFAVTGILEPAVGFAAKQFIIQLFVSTLDMPPQIQTFIGEFTVQAFGSPTEFCELINTGSITLEEGDFITATATAITNVNNNTSEVSNVIVAPECIPQNICELIGRPPLSPPDFNTLCGFISTNKGE